MPNFNFLIPFREVVGLALSQSEGFIVEMKSLICFFSLQSTVQLLTVVYFWG